MSEDLETLPKEWWKSRTILLQVVGALGSLGVFFSGMTPEQMSSVVLLIQIAVQGITIALRTVTNRPIKPVTKKE